MPLHPEAESFVAQIRELAPDLGGELADAATARRSASARGRQRPRPDVQRVEERLIPGSYGVDVPVRIYWPSTEVGVPVVVYFHGGGWVVGDLETHDSFARSMANGTGAVVISVDYRLAPEHRYPAAVEDAYSATVWAAAHAEELGGDASRLAVAGDSAGGNLATVTALQCQERGTPDLAFQLLLYPVTDHDFSTPSYVDSGPDCLLTKQDMMWFWDEYAPDLEVRDHPHASPLRADDLTGLPPAHVLTSGRDPLRSEGQRYAERLAEAGVPTSTQHCQGLFHGFAPDAERMPVAAAAMREVYAVVRAALG
ncbi:alpha/beta hydrolase [Saccharopolyspora rhizosphaerae]|uniref:Alpha/beta hydrolase n=1 Tax=Saccharopolyspora rhizosphaerae TaxID=2492662 RepID=A0A3R8R702_9PSEU|nr:alpha/beta hydrolase [Saccharopolyspora rhizosphaerae]RRO19868.1 alpha/beta hydrolase [Saccharopolyspora rhizosphaerae]